MWARLRNLRVRQLLSAVAVLSLVAMIARRHRTEPAAIVAAYMRGSGFGGGRAGAGRKLQHHPDPATCPCPDAAKHCLHNTGTACYAAVDASGSHHACGGSATANGTWALASVLSELSLELSAHDVSMAPPKARPTALNSSWTWGGKNCYCSPH